MTRRIDAVLMTQDTAGAGHHGASIILSTTSAGASGISHDWLTIASTGMASFAGLLLDDYPMQWCSLVLYHVCGNGNLRVCGIYQVR